MYIGVIVILGHLVHVVLYVLDDVLELLCGYGFCMEELDVLVAELGGGVGVPLGDGLVEEAELGARLGVFVGQQGDDGCEGG